MRQSIAPETTPIKPSHSVTLAPFPLPTAPYQHCRATLAAHLGAGGIAVLLTAPEQQRNRDYDFLFRPDSYFYCLCGFAVPHARPAPPICTPVSPTPVWEPACLGTSFAWSMGCLNQTRIDSRALARAAHVGNIYINRIRTTCNASAGSKR
jgi:hypothetical protein